MATVVRQQMHETTEQATLQVLCAIHCHLERIEQMLWWANLPLGEKLTTPRPQPVDAHEDV